MKKWAFAVSLWLTTALAAATPTTPNYRALLIGVSQYPGLDARLQLEGPKNDAISMRKMLIDRGVSEKNITVVADGVQGSELPTRQNILSSLNALAKSAKPNDYIVIHIGSHGAQQPASASILDSADEYDGLVEVILPRDVADWKNDGISKDGEIKNAITKYELRAAVDQMTAKGAFVWAIFDSCHSATLVRSAEATDVTYRQVSNQDLGIPVDVMDRARERVKAAKREMKKAPAKNLLVPAESPGQAVFFYAAQTTEKTPEIWIPSKAPGNLKRGLFTYTLMQALEGGIGMTYQQLAQQILIRYAGDSRARVTPFFSGGALRSGVLGQPVISDRQWHLEDGSKLTIRAGELADVRKGAVFAILPDAVAKTKDALGYAIVNRASAFDASLEPLAYDGLPKRKESDLKEEGKVARLVKSSPNFKVTVGFDLSNCSQPCPFSEPLQNLSHKTTHSGDSIPIEGTQVQWIDANQSPQLLLKADKRKLWLLPSDQAKISLPQNPDAHFAFLEATPTATSDGLQTALERMLRPASKAINLMRVASLLSTSETIANLQVSLSLRRVNGREAPLTATDVPKLLNGDTVIVSMKNVGPRAIDVTALYFDSKFGVYPQFPRIDPDDKENRLANARLEVNAKTSFPVGIEDSTLGTERLALIAVEARGMTSKEKATTFVDLGQERLDSIAVTRDGRGADDYRIFYDAAFAHHLTRSSEPAGAPAGTSMQVFTWQVVKP